jgi:small subunit ribosomal protein S21
MATKVRVNGNENLDKAIKLFKTKCSRDGIPSEVKKRKFASKPGVKRREEMKENIKNSKKRNKAKFR